MCLVIKSFSREQDFLYVVQAVAYFPFLASAYWVQTINSLCCICLFVCFMIFVFVLYDVQWWNTIHIWYKGWLWKGQNSQGDNAHASKVIQNASIKLMNECLVRKSFTFGSWRVIHADHYIHPSRADRLSTALASSTCSVTPLISSILSPFKRTSFLVDLSFPFTEFLARNNNINHVSFTNVNNLSCTTIIALLTRLRGLALDIKAEKTTCMASCSSTILLHTRWPTLILLQSQGML